MLTEIKAKAYAKVNFNLRVYPKREDGFHSIESIFQTVDLYDELTVHFLDDNIPLCKVTCDSMELPEKNTLTLAYEAFCQVVPESVNVPPVMVELKKGIPSGGGLGGGSSDAAALIRVLQKKCRIELSDSQLDYVAAKTGSDVFFFMYCDSEGKGCALVSGRGEIVKKINPRKDLYLTLIFPDFSSSTKEAYSLVDEYLEKGIDIIYPDFNSLESIYRLSPEKWGFINTFTPALENTYPVLKEILSKLRNSGALYAEMSGSGSTVFGVYNTSQQVTYSSNLLAETLNVFTVRTV